MKKIIIALISFSLIVGASITFHKLRSTEKIISKPASNTKITTLEKNSEIANMNSSVCDPALEISKRPVLDMELPAPVSSVNGLDDVIATVKDGYIRSIRHAISTHQPGQRYEDFIGDRCRYQGEAFFKFSNLDVKPTFKLYWPSDGYTAPLFVEASYGSDVICVGPDNKLSGNLTIYGIYSTLKTYNSSCQGVFEMPNLSSIDKDVRGDDICLKDLHLFYECGTFNPSLFLNGMTFLDNAVELISSDQKYLMTPANTKCNVDGSDSSIRKDANGNIIPNNNVNITQQGSTENNTPVDTGISNFDCSIYGKK